MPGGQGPLQGCRLLMLPRYPWGGPSSRLRMGQFIPRLEAAGAAVSISPFFDDAYLAGYFGSGRKSKASAALAYWRRARAIATANADLVWIEKELYPFLPGWFEGALARRGTRYVVDYDDAIFHSYDRNRRGAVRRLLANKLDPLLTGAGAVTAGNGYLADYAGDHGARRIVRVPTVVDPSRYPVLPPPAGERLRIGWIGTPSNARYLTPLIDAMRELTDRVPMTLVTIGAPELAELPIPQEVHAWSEDSEASLLATTDIGVMPLPDDPFERGKCGYKLIQYMAAARPVIASPVGVNAEIVTGDVGLTATTVAEWVRAISALAADPVRRQAMGAAGRQRVEAQYSVEAVAPVLIDLFADVAGR